MLLSALIIGFAFLTEATLGFGGGLIAVPLLALTMDIKSAVTLVLIFQFCMGFLLPDSYKFVPHRIKFTMTAGLLLGTLLGMYSLFALDDHILRILLSITIVLFLAKDMISKTHITETAWTSALVGFFGSWLQGLIGTGGPVFTMYLSAIRIEKKSFRATLIYLFFVTSILRVIVSFSGGLFIPDVLYRALFAAPFYAVALILGRLLFHRVNEILYRRAVSLVLLGSCVALLLR